MMTTLTEPQARALATLITTLRQGWEHPWDHAGTMTALAQCRDRADANDIAHAALYAAANPNARTPAVIPLAGEHWTRGHPVGTRTVVPMPSQPRCDKHPGELAHNCRGCIADQRARNDEPAPYAWTPNPTYSAGRALVDIALDEARTHPEGA